MSGQLSDRRQERTRAAIVAAFLDLLFARGYSDITVADISVLANVGRSTFYEHFRTKADVLRHTLSQPFGVIAAAVDATPPDDLGSWLEHLRENQSLGRVLLTTKLRDLLFRVLAEEIETRIVASILPAPVAARQIAAAQLALLEPWLMGQMAMTTERMTEALCKTSRALVQVV